MQVDDIGDALAAVQEMVDRREQLLERREAVLDERERDARIRTAVLAAREAIVDEREAAVARLENISQREAALNKREAALDEREDAVSKRERIAEIDQKVHSHKEGEKVILNVGGTRFEVTRGLLTKHEETYFYQLMRGNWPPDENGEHFIDRSPDFMGYILDWYRTDELANPGDFSPEQQQKLSTELDFYGLTGLMSAIVDKYGRGAMPFMRRARLSPDEEKRLANFLGDAGEHLQPGFARLGLSVEFLVQQLKQNGRKSIMEFLYKEEVIKPNSADKTLMYRLLGQPDYVLQRFLTSSPTEQHMTTTFKRKPKRFWGRAPGVAHRPALHTSPAWVWSQGDGFVPWQ
eukprot:TRINITY_DN69097_c0_g1_i1.p1 TRINITY_DN69097_c0_g1~~TRINITY_DN69097_c0_g1_i1.p1  ORF type:complete len:348 (+),score=41.40 TRINITY_DN69097_c0_g1_i1:99-1142(+)